jgi:hypothetical protein
MTKSPTRLECAGATAGQPRSDSRTAVLGCGNEAESDSKVHSSSLGESKPPWGLSEAHGAGSPPS